MKTPAYRSVAILALAAAVVLGSTSFAAPIDTQAQLIAQGSVDCTQGRQIMNSLAQEYGPINNIDSCRTICVQREEPYDSSCYAICEQCYQSAAVPVANDSEQSADISPEASKTERRLLKYLVKYGEKNASELGNGYNIKFDKKAQKKLKFKAVVRNARWSKACAVKLNEIEGDDMPILNLLMSGKRAEKKCKALKPGKKLTVVPVSASYSFMRNNPYTGKSNVGMLFVTVD